jgi:SAM-dependent methyltransferase
MSEFSIEQIRDYWHQQVVKHKQSHAASWSDKPAVDLEVREILQRLEPGDLVLDAGCANGYSTIQFALKKETRVLGLDYLPSMIEQAVQLLEQVKDKLCGTASFEVGNVMSLNQPDNLFDKVLVKRVITNLGEYEQQRKGMAECIRVLKPGGLLLLSDATRQGWEKLNKFREEWHLPAIPMPAFNNYLDREQVIKDLSVDLDLVETTNFASTYFIGTRVLKPLLVRALGLDIDIFDPHMEWNRWFAQLPAWGDYGTQELFVFRKKSSDMSHDAQQHRL